MSKTHITHSIKAPKRESNMEKQKKPSTYISAKAREMLRMIKDGLHLTSREESIFQAGKIARDEEIKKSAQNPG